MSDSFGPGTLGSSRKSCQIRTKPTSWLRDVNSLCQKFLQNAGTCRLITYNQNVPQKQRNHEKSIPTSRIFHPSQAPSAVALEPRGIVLGARVLRKFHGTCFFAKKSTWRIDGTPIILFFFTIFEVHLLHGTERFSPNMGIVFDMKK